MVNIFIKLPLENNQLLYMNEIKTLLCGFYENPIRFLLLMVLICSTYQSLQFVESIIFKKKICSQNFLKEHPVIMIMSLKKSRTISIKCVVLKVYN